MKYFAIAAVLLAPAALARQGSRRGATAMVSAADPRAAAAGIEILKAGGSAMDAVAATALALTVVEPQSSGIGGGGLLVYQTAGGHVPATFDGREKAPLAATERLFLDDAGKPLPRGHAIPGGKSVGVPGNVAMLRARARKIRQAAVGDAVRPGDPARARRLRRQPAAGESIAGSTKTLARQPAAAALFLHPDGTPRRSASISPTRPSPDLRGDRRGGPAAFYSGANAAALVAAVDHAPTNPSTMTVADMAAYRAKERAPVCGAYRSYRVCSMGPPSAGGTAVVAMLGQLQGFDLAALGKDSPVAWHLFAESERLAFADRAAYGGDMDFVSVPVAGLTDPPICATAPD